MFKVSMIAVIVLALSASVAEAQTTNNGSKDYNVGPQVASAPWKASKAPVSFIYDEFGNVYDSLGDIITPTAVRIR